MSVSGGLESGVNKMKKVEKVSNDDHQMSVAREG